MRIDGQFGYGLYAGAGKDRAADDKRSLKGASAGETQSPSTPVSEKDREYLARALKDDDVNVAAVNEAIKLLREGKLDTPEAAERAAEALLLRGP